MSGLQTQGYRACPTYGPDLEGVARPKSTTLRKIVYLGHTKYLPLDHPWRSDPFLYDTDEGQPDMQPQPTRKDLTYWKEVWERVMDPYDSLLQPRSCMT